MIPKKIHYCWFGGKPKPKNVLKCIHSWQKFCPDYEVIEWSESNVDFTQYPYLQWCYENKKWAFLSDFVRLLVVYENGGIYFDTDVEVVKSFDNLLDCGAFYGFETNDFVATGLGFGAVKHHSSLKAMIGLYVNRQPDENGNFQMIGCPRLNTEALLSLGLARNGEYQELTDGVRIYPAEYFNPLESSTGRMNNSNSTYSIHWYMQSACSTMSKIRSKITRPLHRWFGEACFAWLKK